MTTWNPADVANNITLSNGNLTATRVSSTVNTSGRATTSQTTGKKYFEVTANAYTDANNYAAIGVGTAAFNLNTYIGQQAISWGYYAEGSVYSNDTTLTTIAIYAASGVVGCALDFDAGKGWFRDSAGSFGSGNPVAGTGEHFTFVPNTALFPAFSVREIGDQVTANFGAAAFAHSAPSGFSAWDTLSQVDTADKRRSILLRLIPGGPHTVDPDGTLSVADRLPMAGLYSFEDEAVASVAAQLTYGAGRIPRDYEARVRAKWEEIEEIERRIAAKEEAEREKVRRIEEEKRTLADLEEKKRQTKTIQERRRKIAARIAEQEEELQQTRLLMADLMEEIERIRAELELQQTIADRRRRMVLLLAAAA